MKSGIKAIVAAALSLAAVLKAAYQGAAVTSGQVKKRRHSHQTRMTRLTGKRLDKAARSSHPGTVEKLGFKRSDPRHPRHSAHLETYHQSGICNCVGIGHPREALKTRIALGQAA